MLERSCFGELRSLNSKRALFGPSLLFLVILLRVIHVMFGHLNVSRRYHLQTAKTTSGLLFSDGQRLFTHGSLLLYITEYSIEKIGKRNGSVT